jgi:hypothetical protein
MMWMGAEAAVDGLLDDGRQSIGSPTVHMQSFQLSRDSL